jgi:hypothetical protein
MLLTAEMVRRAAEVGGAESAIAYPRAAPESMTHIADHDLAQWRRKGLR